MKIVLYNEVIQKTIKSDFHNYITDSPIYFNYMRLIIYFAKFKTKIHEPK